MQVSLLLVAALATVAQAKPACRAKQKHDRATFASGDHVLRACFEQPNACYALELEGGVAQWRTGGAAPRPTIVEDTQMHAVAKVCTGGTCHSYATPDEPLSLASTYHSADATVAIFEAAIVVFDRATGAERGRSAPGLNIHDVQFFADRFVAFDQETTRIHDVATGKQLVDLGRPMGASLDLGDGTIAMTNRGRLEVFDRTGRIVHAVDTGVEAPGFIVRSRDQRTLAIDGILVDTATWTATPAPPLFCP